MTALTKNLGSTQAAKYGTIQTYSVAASQHIYRGALVVLRQTDGYAYVPIEDVSDTYKQVIVGFAMEEKDNSSGSDGDLSVRVRRDGKYRLIFTGNATQADIGKLACVKDDQTVQRYGSGTGNTVVGRITERVSAASVYADLLDRPLRLATSANN